MASWTDDYTRSRAVGVPPPYEIEDIIGRRDNYDKIVTSTITVSGTPTLLPATPLHNRNYVKVINIGTVDVSIITASGVSAADGILVAGSGGEWEDVTNAPLYIVSTGLDSEVRVYERYTRV
ncbi:MAG TPA: hypothetical protein VI911_08120 [Patescibacteria group bacterium]|nr:hypothetical protein [Patescibacteria group bacterium]